MYLTFFIALVRPATVLAVLEASFVEHSPYLDYAKLTSVACMSGISHHEVLLGKAFNLNVRGLQPSVGHRSQEASHNGATIRKRVLRSCA